MENEMIKHPPHAQAHERCSNTNNSNVKIYNLIRLFHSLTWLDLVRVVG